MICVAYCFCKLIPIVCQMSQIASCSTNINSSHSTWDIEQWKRSERFGGVSHQSWVDHAEMIITGVPKGSPHILYKSITSCHQRRYDAETLYLRCLTSISSEASIVRSLINGNPSRRDYGNY